MERDQSGRCRRRPTGQILPYHGVLPNGVPALLYNAGYANDPPINPGASGPTTGPIPAGYGYAMLVEKGKQFDVTAKFTPYDRPRTFTDRPQVGSVSGVGGYPTNYVQLKDLGLVDMSLTADTPFQTNQLLYSNDEISQTLEVSMFVRVGSANTRFRYLSRQIGSVGTLASGSAFAVAFTSNGSLSSYSPASYQNVLAGSNVFSGTIPVPATGWAAQYHRTHRAGRSKPGI